MSEKQSQKLSPETYLVHSGRASQLHFGVVNTPVYRASTILFQDYQSFKNADHMARRCWRDGGLSYGRKGTPLTRQLEEAILQLEGGDHCLLTPSGVAAIAVVMGSFLDPADHVLISDNVYGPTRSWIEKYGKRFNIDYDFFDPCISADAFEQMINPRTKLAMFESPGSLSFEISDIPALTQIAKQHDVITAIDNSWSAGYYFKPFEHGCDISIQAGTKYYVGHSDALFGSITCQKHVFDRLQENYFLNGHMIDGDTAYLALRGLRTLSVRLKQHQENGLKVANYLQTREDIKQVLHPALKDFPQHDLFKRDFTGASGLFSFILKHTDEQAVERFINGLKLFGIGFSWGGFESLVMPCLKENMQREFSGNCDPNQIIVRLHIGLEDPNDLIKDLSDAFSLMYV